MGLTEIRFAVLRHVATRDGAESSLTNTGKRALRWLAANGAVECVNKHALHPVWQITDAGRAALAEHKP